MRNSFSAMVSEIIFVPWVDMSNMTRRHILSFLGVHFLDPCHSTTACFYRTVFSQWHWLYQVLVSSLFSLNWMIFTIRIPKESIHIIINVSEHPWVIAHLLRLLTSGYLSSWRISHMKILAPIPTAFLETDHCLTLPVNNLTSHLVS